MAESKSNGFDWIHTWVEQHRAAPMRDQGLRRLDAGQSYLQGWQQFA